ncbi:cytochrome c biogenesis protein [Pseudobdellovibrio exovorus]|uniref:Cytochrome C-type biogenesis protein n=1 Tax=Pseudobdellovibrio exovorus JSS TaxID=1184267 RepID=M4VRC2_9BACT|nr:cytochrome c biogenesis protein CcsA [Pseudobdellovibrio exovorus]AGH95729.1 cytochrome C-type biogenesis protein [Pseudobdellovibrio exovorus JSS]
MKKIFFLTLLFSQLVFASVGEQIRYLPVQDSGRVKPFDTFAKETLELVYGKKTYKPKEGAKSVEAYWVVLTWMLSPESWVNRPLFEVKHHEVLEKLKLPIDKKHFTGDEVFKSENFSSLMQELQNKRDTKEKLTPYYQAIQRIENQFFVFREMASGRLLKVYPVNEQDAWLSVTELPQDIQPAFLDVSKNIASYLGLTADPEATSDQIKSAAEKLDESVLHFEELARQSSPEKYKQAGKVKTEVQYNDIHPFRWAYIFYLMASLVLIFIWIRNLDSGMPLAWTLVIIGFVIQTVGFGFRVYLAERPPVTNMYETVVWASWGVILFAMVLEAMYKYKILLLGGSLMGLFALIVADTAPAVLDPSLQPLEAVLRSNYWLIVHVMTITISYAAFLLAFGLGDLGLLYYTLDDKKYADKIQKITTGVYRSMQIGVAFLAPGIILGGIWADYSWGRFWGWDPKETWALIALLGYIIVLHARLVGWLKNFGMLASGVITFSLVIMAWYGVNFVLGAGLHSYGFGAGGVEYVSVFVGLHFLFVAYSYVISANRKSIDKKAT